MDYLTPTERKRWASGEWLFPKIGANIPDRWPYFLARLSDVDKSWGKVTIGACVKIAQETSLEAVTTALGFAHESPPKVAASAFAWLRAAAIDIEEKR